MQPSKQLRPFWFSKKSEIIEGKVSQFYFSPCLTNFAYQPVCELDSSRITYIYLWKSLLFIVGKAEPIQKPCYKVEKRMIGFLLCVWNSDRVKYACKSILTGTITIVALAPLETFIMGCFLSQSVCLPIRSLQISPQFD